MPKIDLSNVKGFEPVPAGIYVASFISHKEGLTKAGDVKIDATFALKDDDFNNKKIFHQFNWSEKSLPYFKAFLACIDVSENDMSDFDTDDLKEYYGHVVSLEVMITPYTNPDTGVTKDSNRVKSIRPYNAFVG